MRTGIYLENNSSKFHPGPIWNYGVLDYLKSVTKQEQEQDK